MKFLNLLDEYKKNNFLTEQDASQQPAPVEAPTPEPEAPEQLDVPASIATMGELLKKALTLNISPEDRASIATQIPKVNEKNANQVIELIISLMKTYSDDINIKIPGTDDVMQSVSQEQEENPYGNKTYANPPYGSEGRVLTPKD
jgi:hypothetical protein